MLSTAAINCQNELEQFKGIYLENSEEDNRLDAPIFDKFYNEDRAAAITEMIKFSPTQFLGIDARSQDHIGDQ